MLAFTFGHSRTASSPTLATQERVKGVWLDSAGFVDAAIADMSLCKAVADHKSIFFAEKSPQGELIDYHAAVSGGLQLVPDAGALLTIASAYEHMVDDGLFIDDAELFDVLLERCRFIEQKANTKWSHDLNF